MDIPFVSTKGSFRRKKDKSLKTPPIRRHTPNGCYFRHPVKGAEYLTEDMTMRISEGTGQKVGTSTDVARILTAILMSQDDNDRDKEHFYSIGLDTKNGIK